MRFCTKCGHENKTGAKFCIHCGYSFNNHEVDAVPEIIKPAPNSNQTTETIQPARIDVSSFQNASDTITEKLGLDKVEGFTIGDFFAEVFKKHDSLEVEKFLSVGTPDTTPEINESMAVMPKPWIFFRAMVGSLATFVLFLISWHTFENVKVIPALIVVGSFAVPFSVLILFFELNTPRNISIFKIVQLVIIGGAISIFFSLVLFQITPFVGVFGASAAGIIEEYGKIVTLITFLGFLGISKYKYRLNALLLGAAVGTGFAAFESAGYALEAGLFKSTDEMISVIQLRGLLSPFAHVAWTAIAAAAFWIARPKFSDSFETLFSYEFLKLFAVPVGLHFVWNFPFDGLFMIKYWILGFIAWVVIISLVQSGLKEIAHLSRNNQ